MSGVSSIKPATAEGTARIASGDGSAVAELQGLYGPYGFPERLLQKIWLRGEFDRGRAATVDGRRVEIRRSGRWNLLGGPDFLGARLRIGDAPESDGDVELHLHAADWAAHGHARDEAYDRVRLHVVLFPPAPGHVTRGRDGQPIPVLALLPLLHHDLEEYAAEDVIEALAKRPASAMIEALGALAPEKRLAELTRHAKERWRQKVHFARLRIRRLGWTEACHQTALEILGFRFNRAPMLRLAAAWPLAAWAGGAAEPDALFAAEREAWSLQGVRPANQPRMRLRQYAMWARRVPDWPERLAAQAAVLPAVAAELSTAEARRRGRLTDLRADWARELAGDTVSGTRFDTLVCDGWLPLLAAQTGLEHHGLWWHWFPGDLPPTLLQSLRALGIFGGRDRPAANGPAQGAIGWLVEREQANAGSD